MTFFLSEALRTTPSALRTFESGSEIKSRIKDSKKYSADGTEPAAASSLLIFATQNQQTWLVCTPKRLYCILDDVRKNASKVQWSEDIGEMIAPDGRILIDITERNKNARTGLVDIGDEHHDWLFSRKLFELISITESISKLLKTSVK